MKPDYSTRSEQPAPPFPIFFQPLVAVISIDEDQIDSPDNCRGQILGRFGSGLPNPLDPPVPGPPDLGLSNLLLEADPQTTERIRIDRVKNPIGGHRTPEPTGSYPVPDADLHQASFAPRIIGQAFPLGLSGLRFRSGQAKPPQNEVLHDAHGSFDRYGGRRG